MPREPLLFNRSASADDPAALLRNVARHLPLVLATPLIAAAINSSGDLKEGIASMTRALNEVALVACSPTQFGKVLHRGISTMESLVDNLVRKCGGTLRGDEDEVLGELRLLAESVLIGTRDDTQDDDDVGHPLLDDDDAEADLKSAIDADEDNDDEEDDEDDDPELEDEEHIDGRVWAVISRTDDSRTYALQVGQEPSVKGTLVRAVSRAQTGSDYGESTSAMQWLPGVLLADLRGDAKSIRKPEKRGGSR